MNKNTLIALTFFLVLVVLFWMMPDTKIEIIGDFFQKIIKPIGIPLSITLGIRFGILKYKELGNKDEP
ncbi:hypothetical protein [Psychroserpens algicola]|uniref:Uncharacterized protein n=1 Tax=Psychroserpens algicola TaxID=1719034 RepID=A0ABT0H3T2_9FLAO|nr:hypothetical protein [Psychroserpens algicola]MCK8479041.1 hypothetical protein [Psychroserpens algicola]